jgi:glycosyltransferase involved in cell wall biosynthesis
MADVIIIQEHLPHYRVAFFEGLRESLAARGISLGLVYGADSDPRMLTTPLPWAVRVPIHRFGPFAWHALGDACKGARLIIVPQETKYLHCHLLWLSSRITGRFGFAYWGHGKNFQIKGAGNTSERIKRFLSRRVDWWFAYNELSANIVEGLGYPRDRITSVGNTVNTEAISRARDAVTAEDCAVIRERLGIQAGPVALFSGALYEQKRIPFLLAAAKTVRSRIPGFQLLVMGAGPDTTPVEEAAALHPWIHYLGPLRDEQKAVYWRLSDVLLMPGLVGLVIVDSFLFGVPMITTDYPFHSPEIDYLDEGVNGLAVRCGEDSDCYAEVVVQLLSDPAKLAELKAGAEASASRHALSGMIQCYSEGIVAAIESLDKVSGYNA